MGVRAIENQRDFGRLRDRAHRCDISTQLGRLPSH
jgi:hypothetical protein